MSDLVQLLVDENRAAVLKDLSLHLASITLNDHQLCDIELLATGAFSPLAGFMTRPDYESVLDRMQLQNGTPWPIPVCLGISEEQQRTLEAGQSVAVRDPEGFLLAVMHVADIWPIDKQREAQTVLGTTDPLHPWANYLFNKEGDYYIGGALEVLSLPLHYDFRQQRLTPHEVRALYHKLGWKRIVGFQTRHPLHRIQFEMTLRAMSRAGANLLLLPIVGLSLPDDLDNYTRVRCYQEALRHYPPNSALLSLLPLAVRMAGPREALLHAIIARNYGCTHFVVGHNHAHPGPDGQGKPFYDNRHTADLAREWSESIGISILAFEEMVYLPFEDEYCTRDYLPAGPPGAGVSPSCSLACSAPANPPPPRCSTPIKCWRWTTARACSLKLRRA